MSEGNVPGGLGNRLKGWAGIFSLTDIGGNNIVAATANGIILGNPTLPFAISGPAASSSGLADMTPDAGINTVNLTGFSTPLTSTLTWRRMGPMIFANFSAATALGNDVTFTVTGIPSKILPPTTTQIISVPAAAVEDNFIVQTDCSAQVTPSTFAFALNGAFNIWTKNAGKGIVASFTTYWLLI